MTFVDEYLLPDQPPSSPRFDLPRITLEIRGTTQRPDQTEFWKRATVHKNTTASKLREAGRHAQADKLEHCHSHYTVAVCSGCRTVRRFPNRCDQFYCAECQPRLANDRRKAVEWWTNEVRQPKHIVLTVKNVPDLTRDHVQQFRKWFTNLRRSKFAEKWRGGFYSIEVTNEGRGWHLHLHALIDAQWIDAIELGQQWTKVTAGYGRIVKVKDARQTNYLREVTKYCVKGVQLAAWSPSEITTFIDAFEGVRTFGVFGSLYGARTKFSEWWRTIRNTKPPCECGCSNITYYTETQWEARRRDQPVHQYAMPPPPTTQQHDLAIDLARQITY